MGIPEDQLRKAAASAVCKINIDSDGRLAVTAKVREYLTNNPSEFDPRKYLGEARKELITSNLRLVVKLAYEYRRAHGCAGDHCSIIDQAGQT